MRYPRKNRRLKLPINIYVALKSLGETEPITEFHQFGIRYFEDEKGWYFKHGELECNAD